MYQVADLLSSLGPLTTSSPVLTHLTLLKVDLHVHVEQTSIDSTVHAVPEEWETGIGHESIHPLWGFKAYSLMPSAWCAQEFTPPPNQYVATVMFPPVIPGIPCRLESDATEDPTAAEQSAALLLLQALQKWLCSAFLSGELPS